jgi:cytochrome b561
VAALLCDEALTLDLAEPASVQPAPKPADLSLDFDLLGKPPEPKVAIDDEAMKRRASMLGIHQKLGLGLAALTLATTVVGQLNYNDKYGANPPVTGKYEAAHTVLAFTTLGVFAIDGTIALLAPGNPVKTDRYDRVTVHKVGMALATVGMLAQGVVGVYANQQEGRIDQAKIARTHLVIGYATLAAMAVAVSALVF